MIDLMQPNNHARRALVTALDQFAAQLNPLPERLADALRLGEQLTSKLKRRSDGAIWRVIAHGSQARGLLLPGFEDVDWMVVYRKDELTTTRGPRYTPGYAIGVLADALDELSPKMIGATAYVIGC